jgi:hypothetical protein
MKKITYILFFSIPAFNLSAQNLVPNSSFENYSTCPNSGGQINYASPWYSPTAGSTDYFNSCGAVGFQPSLNVWGSQNPRTGNAYAEIAVYGSVSGVSAREYLSVQLTDSLVQNKLYCVEFYVNHSGISTFSTMYTPIAVSEIGLLLTSNPISTTNWNVLPYTPQVVSPAGVVLNDTVQWVKVSGIYTALGGEKYITIGNFKNDLSTDTSIVGRPGYDPQGYYFVDDVSIIDCDSLAGVNEQNLIAYLNVYPNPNDGNMTLKYNLEQKDFGQLRIFDLTGKLVYSKLLNPNENQITLSLDLNNGMYFYQIGTENLVVLTGKFIIAK